jgi:hypothetical protein
MEDRIIAVAVRSLAAGGRLAVEPTRYSYVSHEWPTCYVCRLTFWHRGTWLGFMLAKLHFYRQIVRELRNA